MPSGRQRKLVQGSPVERDVQEAVAAITVLRYGKRDGTPPAQLDAAVLAVQGVVYFLANQLVTMTADRNKKAGDWSQQAKMLAEIRHRIDKVVGYEKRVEAEKVGALGAIELLIEFYYGIERQVQTLRSENLRQQIAIEDFIKEQRECKRVLGLMAGGVGRTLAEEMAHQLQMLRLALETEQRINQEHARIATTG